MQVNAANNVQNVCTNCVPTQPQPQTLQPQTSYQQAPMQINPPQSLQVPSTSGVNIQIFNPSVTAAGAPAPTYNVNAPNYYPPNYYTDNIAQNACKKECDCPKNADSNGLPNNVDTVNSDNSKDTEVKNNTNSTNETSKTETVSETVNTNETKNTEKKKVVELTDQYIMNLESYLNSQDKDIRLSGAKEVYARLEEDPSRKGDKALTALINKMLQDPVSEIRMLALAALDGRYVLGDDYTAKLLQNMQSQPDGYGQDAVDAAQILLKMSGKQVEKEVEIDPARQKKTVKTETNNKSKTNKG